MSINLRGNTTYTLEMDDDYARKLFMALTETLHQFDTSDPRYVELVNRGRIDTLVVLRNLLGEEVR